MKKLFAGLSIFTVLFISCQKNKEVEPVKPPEVVVPAKPAASFKIDNAVNGGNQVMESDPILFRNESTNAESYFWDFGNGITSTEKTPADISLVPCYTDFVIKLTVKSKTGETATYSMPVTTLCKGKHVPQQ